jgi:hypothetical protein
MPDIPNIKCEIVNEDVRYLRDHCPPTATSVSGTGPGSVCRCDCPPPTPPEPPKPPPPKHCVKRVVVNNLTRYTARTNNTHIRVC